MNEIIYILINESMPGYIKIGRTTNLNQRLKSLYRTQVPLPFEVFYACTVENGTEIECWLFDIFEDRRVSKDREFFEVPPERVAVALRAKAIKEVTPKGMVREVQATRLRMSRSQENTPVERLQWQTRVRIPTAANSLSCTPIIRCRRIMLFLGE